MKLTQSNIAYIEADFHDPNLFLLQPICNEFGVFSEKDCLSLFPDQGYLRVVPDKKEKTTFKSRLRKLFPLCLVKLSNSPQEEKKKIRSNRNYNISDEKNQQVVYSDAILPLTKDLIYEVITISSKENLSTALASLHFVTPKAYIQRDNIWYGPFISPPKRLTKKTDRLPSHCLFSYQLYGKSHLFYYPPLESLLAFKEKSFQKDTLPIGKPLEILDKNLDFDAQLANISQPLSKSANFLKSSKDPSSPKLNLTKTSPIGTGTPLYARANKPPTSQKEALSFDQVVANQLGTTSSSAPTFTSSGTTNQLPSTDFLRLHPQALKKHLQALSTLPVFNEFISDLFFDQSNNPYQLNALSAFTHQVETLEAERLSLVLQLDQAKRDQDQFTKDFMIKEKKLLSIEADTLTFNIETFKKEESLLLQAQEELLSSIKETASVNAAILSFSLISQVAGSSYTLSHVLHHVQEYLKAAGYQISHNQIISLIFLISTNQRFSIVHPDKSFSYAFFQVFLESISLGKQHSNPGLNSSLRFAPPIHNGSPYFLLYHQPNEESVPHYCKKVFFCETSEESLNHYLFSLSPWPIYLLDISIDLEKHLTGLPHTSLRPLSLTTIEGWFLEKSNIFKDASSFIQKITSLFPQFPFRYIQLFHHYVDQTADLSDNGIIGSMDVGLSLFLLPLLSSNKKLSKEEETFLSSFPFTKALFHKIKKLF